MENEKYKKARKLPRNISLDRKSGKFRARFMFNGKKINCGSFETQELAQKAVEKKRVELKAPAYETLEAKQRPVIRYVDKNNIFFTIYMSLYVLVFFEKKN